MTVWRILGARWSAFLGLSHHRAKLGQVFPCGLLVALLYIGGTGSDVAAPLRFPPAQDYPFGSLSTNLVEKNCTVEPGCTPAKCSAGSPFGLGPTTILGSHLRGTDGPFAVMSVSTGFALVIDASTGEQEYRIGGNATLVFNSPSGGTLFFSSVIPARNAPSIGNSFPFTVQKASADDGFTFDITIKFPFCKLPVQGRYR